MSPEIIAENAVSRAELRSLIESLQHADYARPVGASRWTVATALCHLAYWDHVAVKYLDQWKRTGKAVRFEADAIDTVNRAGLEVFRAVPGPQPPNWRCAVPKRATAK